MITTQQHEGARAIVWEIANKPAAREILRASEYRGKSWERAGINNLTRSMDLYATTRETARKCVRTLQRVMSETGCEPPDAYVEPSAGTGAFLEALSADQAIAMDILPRHPRVRRQEFLTWTPPPPADGRGQKRHVVVGAPPPRGPPL